MPERLPTAEDVVAMLAKRARDLLDARVSLAIVRPIANSGQALFGISRAGPDAEATDRGAVPTPSGAFPPLLPKSLVAAMARDLPDWLPEIFTKVTGETPERELIGVSVSSWSGNPLGVVIAADLAEPVSEQTGALLLALTEAAGGALDAAEARAHLLALREARGKVLAHVSHELRDPLNTISLSADVLLMPKGTEAQRKLRLEAIQRSVRRATGMLDDLTDTLRLESHLLTLDLGPHAVQDLIDTVLAEFAPLADAKGVALRTDIAGEPVAMADPVRVTQVIRSLVSNALNATSAGEVTVGARQARPDGDVSFEVRDTGIGIPPDDLPRVFERFWRRKQAGYRGAGLGLTVARGIVEQHGGQIRVESEVGRGTTVTFTLPGREGRRAP